MSSFFQDTQKAGGYVPIDFPTSSQSRRADPPPNETRDFPPDHLRILHERLVATIKQEKLSTVGPADRFELRQKGLSITQIEKWAYSSKERDQLVELVLNRMLGYGPLQPLLDDPTISDILVNNHTTVYVERRGLMELTDVKFANAADLKSLIDKIVSAVGRRVDELSPMVDARLPDGSRVNAAIPPIAIDGPALSIRKFGSKPLTAQDLLKNKCLSPAMLEFLLAAVRARVSLLISGGTGAGKTTLLNVLSRAIDEGERTITIEDAAELQLQQRHVVRFETRPPSVEGKGEIRQRELVVNALRMRPDRIILGEVRDAAAFDLLAAMNTGHYGSIATIHANTPRDCISRLTNMVMQAEIALPEKSIYHQIASAVQMIVQISRMRDGVRRVTNISAVTGMPGDVIGLQEVFVFKQTGVDATGSPTGLFTGNGLRPDKILDSISMAGLELSHGIFNQKMEV